MSVDHENRVSIRDILTEDDFVENFAFDEGKPKTGAPYVPIDPIEGRTPTLKAREDKGDPSVKTTVQEPRAKSKMSKYFGAAAAKAEDEELDWRQRY